MKIETEIGYIYMHMYMALISFVAADWKKLQFFKFQKKKKYFKPGSGYIMRRISFLNFDL